MTVWQHVRKGRLAGDVVWSDDTWTDIRLTEDGWSDARHRHPAGPGDVIRCRTAFLTEMDA